MSSDRSMKRQRIVFLWPGFLPSSAIQTECGSCIPFSKQALQISRLSIAFPLKGWKSYSKSDSMLSILSSDSANNWSTSTDMWDTSHPLASWDQSTWLPILKVLNEIDWQTKCCKSSLCCTVYTPALYLHCMTRELQPYDPLFEHLVILPGMNMWTDPRGETKDLDYKHDFKHVSLSYMSTMILF